MANQHFYKTNITWTGNRGEGTSGYKNYDRSHSISVPGKPHIEASSDPAFRGDAEKYNPEELFLASLSSCHMLWYLHLCSDNGIIVLEYIDSAIGTMEENTQGGKFTEVTLFPAVKVADASMVEKAITLHGDAHKNCFIANSCNFPVRQQPSIGIM
ncbi:MAG: OsmC family peroxiredoxin [Chitinophagaceae bacterium]|nr:MAG: OsmC family peroxiredoxin [Chitinophagaceae bacterium]